MQTNEYEKDKDGNTPYRCFTKYLLSRSEIKVLLKKDVGTCGSCDEEPEMLIFQKKEEGEWVTMVGIYCTSCMTYVEDYTLPDAAAVWSGEGSI